MILEAGDGSGRRLTEGQFTCSVPVAACHGVPHCSLS